MIFSEYLVNMAKVMYVHVHIILILMDSQPETHHRILSRVVLVQLIILLSDWSQLVANVQQPVPKDGTRVTAESPIFMMSIMLQMFLSQTYKLMVILILDLGLVLVLISINALMMYCTESIV